MSAIETVSDVENAFLSRREITCVFAGLGGRLGKLEAAGMVSERFGLGGKTVIPMGLKNHVGRPAVTGTFYVYGDEAKAKAHIRPAVFERLEKARKAAEEKAAGGAAGPDGGE